ncbi:3-phosphoshikimate 1-carboxyvinyltransferase [uncultured Desulfobacter sp.]|uniref:3-phosphoshikimate 1-carboxyvinyltransferase n=1 Tax=uncultured Desulfobacter sp. TaxID=240139 RepID=UPI002AAB740D|nr:3-phosphoshikimate 1-carboxyvinyltransferase [uncultured Desulfobacter sp.]
MKQVIPRSIQDQVVRIPGSKSISHRMLICAALADGTSEIYNVLDSQDISLTRKTLGCMGAKIESRQDGTLSVTGFGGRPKPWPDPIHLGNSGTSMRLLAGIAALGSTPYTLTGDERMCQRPMGELLDALSRIRIRAYSQNDAGTPPVVIQGTDRAGGRTLLDCSRSSQYLSALLMAGAFFDQGLVIDLTAPPVSQPYIDLTLDVMKQFGVNAFQISDTSYEVPGDQTYLSGTRAVEPDLSNAGYFWAAGAVTGADIGVDNIGTTSLQGDVKQAYIFEKMGCTVNHDGRVLRVKGHPMHGVDVDMSDTPDAVPAVAVTAAFAKGTTRISNIGHLRVKECDRIDAVCSQLTKMGIKAEQGSDFMEITGGTPHGAVIETFNDHRIAMAFAVAGLMVDGIEIENPGCVEKSFPTFWQLFDVL